MKWVILAVGKLRSRCAIEGVAEYTRRIVRLQPVEMVEVAAAKAGDDDAVRRARTQEAERLLSRVRAGDYVILLDERGKPIGSMALAKKLNDLNGRVRSRLVFVIGGAFGVDASVAERADETLSLGPLTLPHELARLILAEQLYRALTIQRNIPYHHS